MFSHCETEGASGCLPDCQSQDQFFLWIQPVSCRFSDTVACAGVSHGYMVPKRCSVCQGGFFCFLLSPDSIARAYEEEQGSAVSGEILRWGSRTPILP